MLKKWKMWAVHKATASKPIVTLTEFKANYHKKWRFTDKSDVRVFPVEVRELPRKKGKARAK